MAAFRSFNVLGLVNMIKQPMPTEVLGDDGNNNPVMIPTPLDDGGVMCLGTADINVAARRNWKHAGVGGTIMGVEVTLSFDLISGGIVPTMNYTEYPFTFGTVDVLEDQPADDFTGGDPHLETTEYFGDEIALGTIIQRTLDDTSNSTQPFYFQPRLKLQYHGYRWWEDGGGNDAVMAGLSLILTGTIRPETGYKWEEGANLAEQCSTWVSNWKVRYIDGLNLWGLENYPLGGPDFLIFGSPQIGDAVASVVFSQDDNAGEIPLRGYNLAGFIPESRILLESCVIHIPIMLAPLAPL